MATPCVDVDAIERRLSEFLTPLGFEIYPFKVGWYNAVLAPSLQLPYPEHTVAVVVLSTPSMFERAFKPFLERCGVGGLRDPIDQCVARCISTCVCQFFPDQPVDISYDYDMLPDRKPKFLAQTAAHVAGAAYYYQRTDIINDPWGEKKIFGVCIHPRLGGWFAIRALLVFPGVEAREQLIQKPPPDCVPSQENRLELLERFNFHWQDWTYRDIIPSVQCYSEEQKSYFSTPPGQRALLLRDWGFLPEEKPGPQLPGNSQEGQVTS